jgi:hypothetical protein
VRGRPPHHLQDVRLLGLFRDITLHRGQVQSARVLVQGSPGGPHDTRRYHVQWRARNFAHIGHFTGIILLKCDTGDSFVPV